MKREMVVATALVVGAASVAGAGERRADDARRANRADAPRLLKEAVRTGDADIAAFAAIADWILYEKEEKVAAGLTDVLAAVDPTLAGPDGERWNATTRAVVSLFTSALRDAKDHRRRSGDETDAEVAALVSAAAPAVAAALAESDPRAWASIVDAIGGVAHAADRCEPPAPKP